MSTVGRKVTIQNLFIIQGDDFILPITMYNPAVTINASPIPVNLTGCSVISQIRKTYNSPDPVVVFTSTISATPTDGSFALKLSHAQTSALDCGSTENDPKSQYVWDVKLIDAAGLVTTIMGGTVVVYREITK